jgi:hypothetical protein
MKIKLQLIIDNNNECVTEDVIHLERDELSAETLGLTLTEAKNINAKVQEIMVTYQMIDFTAHHRRCSCCGQLCSIKGYHPLIYRTLFGKVRLRSPRLFSCRCYSQRSSTFSPLAQVLTEHVSPELSYLESKWASLMPYGLTAKLLKEVFPVEIHPSSVYRTTSKVANRLEQELGEEQATFIEGCPRDWNQLPRPDTPITVSLDGGYVHARKGNNRKAGWFEVIVGKSLQEGRQPRRFGYVINYDRKPKRRLYEMLEKQGLQLNQDITFLTDGGDTVRDLPLYLSPRSEHILDWFHVAMRMTVIKQISKGAMGKGYASFEKQLLRIKWFLWHGNVYQALDALESLIMDLDLYSENKAHKKYKLWRVVSEFHQYIQSNSPFIPNYGERYRHGESVSSACAESAVNELISKRMVKSQQMRWTQKGAHLLLQVRSKTLNGDLIKSFKQWYPKIDDHKACPSLAA